MQHKIFRDEEISDTGVTKFSEIKKEIRTDINIKNVHSQVFDNGRVRTKEDIPMKQREIMP